MTTGSGTGALYAIPMQDVYTLLKSLHIRMRKMFDIHYKQF
jgi:hypothetical protein